MPNPQIPVLLRPRANPERKDLQVGIRRIEDPHHPRGYRELRSPAEMRKLLNRKIVEPGRICAICHFEFTDYNAVVRDHKTPKGIGGASTTIIPRTQATLVVQFEQRINEDGRVTAD